MQVESEDKFPVLRSADEIVAAYRRHRARKAAYRPRGLDVSRAAEVVDLARVFAGAKLGADFIWLDARAAQQLADTLDSRFDATVSSTWWPFAVTGQGDAWLFHVNDGTVAFWDHDAKAFAPSLLRISLADWTRLADFLGRLEALSTKNRDSMLDAKFRLLAGYRRRAAAEIDKLARGLTKRLPFDL